MAFLLKNSCCKNFGYFLRNVLRWSSIKLFSNSFADQPFFIHYLLSLSKYASFIDFYLSIGEMVSKYD